MQLRYGPPRADDFEEIVANIPSAEFKKLTRSTIPLLCWFRDVENVSELLNRLNVGAVTQAWFERPVRAGCATCEGRGKSSFTDLMLEGDDYVLAIEAKHTENVYENVRKWLGEPASETKQKVLKHWMSCLLRIDDPPNELGELVYQMVHRAASARDVAGQRTAHVIHLLFGNAHVAQYVEASTRAQRVLGDVVRFHVIDVTTAAGIDQARVVSDDRPDALRDAIINGARLFEFTSLRVC